MISYRSQTMDMKLMTRALEYLDIIHATSLAISMPEQKYATERELLLILEPKQYLYIGDLVEPLQDNPKNFGLQFSYQTQPAPFSPRYKFHHPKIVMPSNESPSFSVIV
ncbi:uncharacterized protein EAE98_011705 [Botrytis deweyae]|uniref:Uncharacterized protein n=1 Tax=Botrytis deweyae TaxID=2478750 RepID=A0ABQ7I5A1_9HELO|nr:uncharacterized protein EAE98_011705 [Botrytis deweyae]KAF7913155.1 hypothetical protein EAE98_011705 [Botrytis deweyae]